MEEAVLHKTPNEYSFTSPPMSEIYEDISTKIESKKFYGSIRDSVANPHDLCGDRAPSILFDFLCNKFSYLLKNDPNALLSKREIIFRKRVNNIIKLIGSLFLSNPQIIENRNTLKNPDDIRPDIPITVPNEPVIWTPNHGFKDDPLATVLAIKRNAYFVFGSLPQFFNTIDGLTAWLNGVLMLNRKVSSSRKAIIGKCTNALNNGVDLIIYPEGILNKSANNLILPLWPGIYRLCKETGSKVVPVIHYLRDLGLPGKDNCIHTVVDDPIRIDDLSEKAGLEYLRDTMATWHYLLIERYGKSTRKETLGETENTVEAWEICLKRLRNTMDYYDPEIELCADYRPNDIIQPESVWKSISEIKSLSPYNVCHVIYAIALMEQRAIEDFQRRF